MSPSTYTHTQVSELCVCVSVCVSVSTCVGACVHYCKTCLQVTPLEGGVIYIKPGSHTYEQREREREREHSI